MRIYILYGFGILLCIAGVGYLAAEYIKYLSEPGKAGVSGSEHGCICSWLFGFYRLADLASSEKKAD